MIYLRKLGEHRDPLLAVLAAEEPLDRLNDLVPMTGLATQLTSLKWRVDK